MSTLFLLRALSLSITIRLSHQNGIYSGDYNTYFDVIKNLDNCIDFKPLNYLHSLPFTFSLNRNCFMVIFQRENSLSLWRWHKSFNSFHPSNWNFLTLITYLSDENKYFCTSQKFLLSLSLNLTCHLIKPAKLKENPPLIFERERETRRKLLKYLFFFSKISLIIMKNFFSENEVYGIKKMIN